MSTSHLRIAKTIVEKDSKYYVQLSIVEAPAITSLKPNQVVVRIEAAPINPSDIGPLFAPSHGGIGKFDAAVVSKDAHGRTVTLLPIPGKFPKSMIGRSARVGNECAGRVVATGSGAEAQSMMGKLVACLGMGGAYGQQAVVNVSQIIVHHDTTSAEEAASSHINPLTALGMTKTMVAEHHKGIVHTAAASQLGQMLVKICLADNIPLVNIVRRQEQVDLLHSIGAKHVVDSSSHTFHKDLVHALVVTGATIAFDALGGGDLGFQIIKAMETAANKKGASRSNYGSTTYKKLYVYGGLNAGQPLILRPHAGMGGFSWGVAGFLMGIGAASITAADKKRVADEISTTFATNYAQRLTLESMLDPTRMKEFQAQKSNQKCLVMPNTVSAKSRL
jgi:NADPH:quinone reductase-like Zn-dependent oxidoreductase